MVIKNKKIIKKPVAKKANLSRVKPTKSRKLEKEKVKTASPKIVAPPSGIMQAKIQTAEGWKRAQKKLRK